MELCISRCNKFKNFLSQLTFFCVSYSLVFAPVLSYAQVPQNNIVIDNNAHAGGQSPNFQKSSNGTDVLNIVAPTDKGVSHNKFTDYNVNEKNLIVNNFGFNNGTGLAQGESTIGGTVAYNHNLGLGKSARVILNEVTSNSTSSLKGYTEIFGDKAALIIANPNGITCEGCGFINTTRLSMVTGRANMIDGDIKYFSMSPVGIINIKGVGQQNFGLHVDQAPAQIVSNMVKIAGLVLLDEDQNLDILTGNASYDYKNNKISSDNVDRGVEVAVDSTALGGMRAGSIRIHATQKGFGVNTDGALIADMDKVEITADGNIVYKNVAANKKINIKSESGGVTAKADGSTYAPDSIEIAAKTDVNTNGEYIYSKDVSITAGRDITNTGQIAADNKITLASNGKTTNAGEILSYGTLSAAAGDNLTNENSMLSVGKMDLATGKDFKNTGEISASDTITINADGKFTNTNEIMTAKSLTITNGTDFNNSGDILAMENVSIIADGNIVNSGELSAAVNIEAETKGTFSNIGSILSSAVLKIKSWLGFSNESEMLSMGAMELTAGENLTNTGEIASNDNIIMNIGGDFTNEGEMMASKELSASIGNDMINKGELVSLETMTFEIGRDFSNINTGEIATAGGLNISTGRDISNKSGLYSRDNSDLDAGRNFTNEADIVLGGVSAITSANNILNKGEISSSYALFMEAGGDITNQNKINANVYLDMKAKDIHNYGQIASNSDMTIETTNDFINYRDSAVLAGGSIVFKVTRNLINYMAEIFALGNIDITGTGGGKSAVDINKVYDNPFVADTRTYDPKGNSTQDATVGEYEEPDEPMQIHLTDLDETLTIPLDAFGENSQIGDTYTIGDYILVWGGSIDDLTIKNADDEDFAFTIVDDFSQGEDENIDTSGNTTEKESGKLSDYANSTAFVPLANAMNALVNKGGRIESYSNININTDKLYNLGVDYNLGEDGYTTAYHWIRSEACWNCGQQELGRYYVDQVNFNSISGLILAGGDMNISSREILNQSSTLSAKNNLNIKTDNLTNKTSSYLVDLIIKLQTRKKSKNATGRVSRKTWNADLVYQDRVYSKSNAIITAGNNLVIDATGGRINNDQDEDATGNFYFGQDQNTNLSHQNKDVVLGGLNLDHGTISVSIRLPQGTNGLFVVSHDPRYLVVSNAPFLNVNNFLGSPYFFDRITSSSNEYNFAKIIGDPIYETRLVMDAIRQATAGHYLGVGNIGSDMEQMKALYDSAIEQADTLKLTVGIALTKDQIAALTNDIIWYVEKEVNGEKVLVPELYLSQATRAQIAMGGTGAKMTGGNVLMTADTISNSGDIFAKNELVLKADYLNNESSWNKNARIIGDKTLIEADLLKNSGGTIGGRITQIAAGTLINETQVYSEELKMGKNYELTEKTGYTGTIYGNDGVKIDVENTLFNRGANIESANGNISITAQNAIFDTVELHNRSEQTTKKKGAFSKKSTTTVTDSITNVGSEIAAAGNIILKTEDDATLRGSTLIAGESALLDIGGNLNLVAAKDSEYSYSQTKKSSMAGLKSSKDTVIDETQYLVGSNIVTMDGLTIVSGKDTNVIGSNIITGGDANIYTGYHVTDDGKLEKSGHDGSLNVLNDYVTNSHFEEHIKKDYSKVLTEAGLAWATGGVSMLRNTEFSDGKLTSTIDLGEQSKNKQNYVENIVVGSVLDIGGNLNVTSANDINIRASDIYAGSDINLTAEGNINMSSAANTIHEMTEEEKSKISTSATVGNAYVDAGYAAKALVEAIEAEKKAADNLKKMQDLKSQGKASQEAVNDAAANLAMATANVANATLGLTGAAAGAASAGATSFGTGMYASGGVQYETSKTTTTQDTNNRVQSNLASMDGNINLKSGNDITQEGTNIYALNGTLGYDAGNDLKIESSKDTYKMDTKSEHMSAGATVGNNAVQVDFGMGGSSGKVRSTTNQNSEIQAKDIVIKTGNDALISGVNMEAGTIAMDIGNDLKVESQQDTYYAKNSDWSMNVSVGTSGGGGGFSKGSGNTDSAWVYNQTSIIGNDSVDIKVGNKTTIDGAIIASGSYDENGNFTDAGNLKLDTKELEYSDIKDFYKDESSSFGLQSNWGQGTDRASSTQHANGTTTINMENKGYEKEQLTKATIGQGTIIVGGVEQTDLAGLNRDVNNSQEITKDMITGALDGSITIDNRIFTSDGRTSIANDFKNFDENVAQIGKGLRNNIVTKSIENAYKDENTSLLQAIGDYIRDDGKIAEIQKNKEMTAELNGATNLSPEQAQALLQQVADIAGANGGFTGDLSIANVEGNVVGFAYIDASGQNKYISVNLANVDLSDPSKLVNVVFHETTNFERHEQNDQTAKNRADTAEGIWDLKNFGNANTNGTTTGADWLNKNQDSSIIQGGSNTLVNNVVNSSLGEGRGEAHPAVAIAIPAVASGIETTYINMKRQDGETYDQAKARLKAEGSKLLIVTEFPGEVMGEAGSYLVAGADGLYQATFDSDGTPVKDGLVLIGRTVEEGKQYLINKYPEQQNLIESSLGATGTALDWTGATGIASAGKNVVTRTIKSVAKTGSGAIDDAVKGAVKNADNAVKGGSYSSVRKSNVGGEVHHMPANSVSEISTGKGPSILMEAADHTKTASYKNSADAIKYRAEQQTLINQGKYRDAVVKDVKDVRSNFGTKYNDSMLKSIDYMKTLPEFKK